MPRKKLFLEPAATGLVIANIVVIGVVIASVLVTRRAWELRETALTALAEARAEPARSVAVAHPLAPALHAPPRKLRASAMDRILLCGILGIAGSAFFTWRLVRSSSSLSRLRNVDERAGVRATLASDSLHPRRVRDR